MLSTSSGWQTVPRNCSSSPPHGLFRFNRLVMGAHAASEECHGKLNKVLHGLPGVVQIKDNMCVHCAWAG